MAYSMEPSEVEALVEQNPSMKQYKRVRKLLDANRAKAETQPGGMFRDFEISYDGVTHRLSDVVGRGGYVLVDFWASWCGPCIRQTAVIKDLYNEFKDKGLRVLGVAVWDEPQGNQRPRPAVGMLAQRPNHTYRCLRHFGYTVYNTFRAGRKNTVARQAGRRPQGRCARRPSSSALMAAGAVSAATTMPTMSAIKS